MVGPDAASSIKHLVQVEVILYIRQEEAQRHFVIVFTVKQAKFPKDI